MSNFKDTLREYFKDKDLLKIQTAKIGIAGLGGLGSNCAANLVRSGIINLTLVDFDYVEDKNLNRQFFFQSQIGTLKVKALTENLKKINPDIKITSFSERIEKDNVLKFFGQCEIVVEAFDKAEYKSLLVSELMPTKKLIVSASGLAGCGNSDEIKVHRIKENLIIVGDLTSEAAIDLPPLSPRVNIAAAKQADAILEYILKNKS
ncbi:MAG: sulfur carrier protein ThiS adenylyltransferase ThiF [Candidatus Omnitrophica bacterium]|jgi:sulfur carrier protein ThiS adenylyltransferase|nr:sulfur carrier protein ThiS adenylyltransferase ThiF [Candidatus Omnitrophota bacterium]